MLCSEERKVKVEAKFQATPRRSALVRVHMLSGSLEILSSAARLSAPLWAAADTAAVVAAAQIQVRRPVRRARGSAGIRPCRLAGRPASPARRCHLLSVCSPPRSQAVCGIVHGLTSFWQMRALFGVQALMVPAYLIASCLKVVLSASLLYDPANLDACLRLIVIHASERAAGPARAASGRGWCVGVTQGGGDTMAGCSAS